MRLSAHSNMTIGTKHMKKIWIDENVSKTIFFDASEECCSDSSKRITSNFRLSESKKTLELTIFMHVVRMSDFKELLPYGSKLNPSYSQEM